MNTQKPLRFVHDNKTYFFDPAQGPLGALISDGKTLVLPKDQNGKLISALIQSENGALDADAIKQITRWGDFGNDALLKPKSLMRQILRDVCQDKTAADALIDNTNTTLRFIPNGGQPTPAEAYHLEHARIPMKDLERFKKLERDGLDDLKEFLNTSAEMFSEDIGQFLEKTSAGARLPFHRVDLSAFGPPTFPIPIESGHRPPLVRDPKQIALKANPVANLYNGKIFRLHSVSPSGWRLGRTAYFDLMEDCDWMKGALLRGWGAQADVFAKRKWLRTSPIVAEWRSRARAILRGDFSGYLAGMAFNLPIVGCGPDGLEILLAKGSPHKQADAGRRHVCPAGMLEFSRPNADDIDLSAATMKTYMRKELIEETLRRSKDAPDPLDIEARIKRLEGQIDTNGDLMGAATLGMACDEIIDLIRKENLSLPVGEQTSLAAHDALMAMDIESSPMALIVDALVLRPEIVMPIKIDAPVTASFNWENVKIAKSEPVPTWKVGDSLAETEQDLCKDMSDWAAPGLAGVLIAVQQHLPRNGGKK